MRNMTSHPRNTLDKSDNDGSVAVMRTENLTAKQQKELEIEANGRVVKDFMVGNTRIKINDAYCRDKTPADVEAILAEIAEKAQAQLSVQAAATKPKVAG